jgi:G:T/U-mismatch repair DNA glycosylase
MPIGEREIHPYLQDGEIAGSTKLILGSFPVYECVNYNKVKDDSNSRTQSVLPFFYGSENSKFWELYRSNVDGSITPIPKKDLILASLKQHKIAISDTILSCERHEYSSSDNDLINRTYNVQGVQALIQKGVKKVLCTSKGVLKDLEKQILCAGKNSIGHVDDAASAVFQQDFLNQLGGNNKQVTGPIAKVFIINNKPVKALAIPSPGSPQRQLASFGFVGTDWRTYANHYFSSAFTWLVQDGD